tara:strand:- start:114 stop:1007 length:894 start_codon:yes stop_codon:yes gene_type:complete
MVTNKFDLPKFVVDALTYSDYTRGDSDISVTQLIDSPRIARLQREHADEQTKDVVDFVWSRFGTSVHVMFEESLKATGSDVITEERLFTETQGWSLSGAIDAQEVGDDGVTISDFKVTSAWSVIYGKSSWDTQLNVYAYLVRKAKGQTVKKLQIVALLRDWVRSKAQQGGEYPTAPIVVLDIPMWSEADQDAYVESQIKKHIEATNTDQPLIYCTSEETWQKDTVYAVMKKGRKTAIRLYKTEAEANERVAKEGNSHFVDIRFGEKTRCKGDWCGVSKWCDQYQSEAKEQFLDQLGV